MQDLTPTTYAVTRAALVAYAQASGDPNTIHQDPEVARSVGLPDVIAHGMLTMAYAGRVVTDWAGDPGAVVRYGTATSWVGIGGVEDAQALVERWLGPLVEHDAQHRAGLVETLETSHTWSRLGELHAAVATAIRNALDAQGTPGLAFCHLSHAYPDGASLYFTFIARAKHGEEIEQWRAIKRAASEAIVAAGEMDLSGPSRKTLRKAVRRVERHGYTILPARDADEATAIEQRHEQPIHLLVSDMIMPGGFGPDVARALRAVNPRARIIFMSGYADDAIRQRGSVEPDAQLLQKPFTREVLLQAVDRALHGEGSGSSSGS